MVWPTPSCAVNWRPTWVMRTIALPDRETELTRIRAVVETNAVRIQSFSISSTIPIDRDSGIRLPPHPSALTSARGYRWHDFLPIFTQVHTILPPNSSLCTGFNDSHDLMATVSSRHQGGAHVLMADGAVVFVTDSMEAGNSSRAMTSYHGAPPTTAGEQSPYGLWGALGTRANKEVIEEQLNQ